MTSKKGTDFLERARDCLPGGWLGDLTLPDDMMSDRFSRRGKPPL